MIDHLIVFPLQAHQGARENGKAGSSEARARNSKSTAARGKLKPLFYDSVYFLFTFCLDSRCFIHKESVLSLYLGYLLRFFVFCPPVVRVACSLCVSYLYYTYTYMYIYILSISIYVYYIYIYLYIIYIHTYIYILLQWIYSCKTPKTFIYSHICETPLNHPLRIPNNQPKTTKKKMRRNREKMSQDTRKPRTPIDDRESLAIVTGEPSMSSQSLFQTNILYQQFLHLISYPLVPKFLFLVLCSIHFSVRLRTSSPVSRERVSF